jgi:ATP synthase F1 delta subunit
MSFSKKIVTTYTKALFQIIKNLKGESIIKDAFEVSKIISPEAKNLVPTVYIIGEELSLLRSTLISSKKVKEYFDNPTRSEEQKLDVLLTIFPGLTSSSRSFLKILTERRHLSLLPDISEEFNKMVSSFQSLTKVKLITASPLKESYGLILLNKLREITNSKDIILNVTYNQALLGGFILEYNSTSIDASILNEFGVLFSEL